MRLRQRVFMIGTVVLGATCLGACDSASNGVPPGAGAGGSPAGTGGHGGQPGQGGQPGGITEIATIMATYQTWQPQSAAAVDISAQIFSLCRSPTATETRFTESIHSRYALRDWANPAAVAGIAVGGVGGFPIGATIVKEKFAQRTTDGTLALAALGIMIKRGAGFDPAGGDWEFVYWNEPDGVSRGPADLAACGACHAAAATDFVFLDPSWRTAAGP